MAEWGGSMIFISSFVSSTLDMPQRVLCGQQSGAKEIALSSLYLASDASSFTATLVDGGVSICKI